MTAVRELSVFAPAKINLFLHVGDKRADGYHDICSLVVFADVGDTLTATPADRLSLAITGPFAGALEGEGDDNLVLRAATALQDWARATGRKLDGARLTLEKESAGCLGHRRRFERRGRHAEAPERPLGFARRQR